jgi:hypothetical protein
MDLLRVLVDPYKCTRSGDVFSDLVEIEDFRVLFQSARNLSMLKNIPEAYLIAVNNQLTLQDTALFDGARRLSELQRTTYGVMQTNTIHGAVFSTFGKDLDAVASLAEVNVYLAVLAIELLLTTHPPMAHVEAMLDTPTLEPRLPSNLDSERWFQVCGETCPSCDGPIPLDIRQDAAGNN